MIREFRRWLVAGVLVIVMPAGPLAGSEEIPRLTFAQLVDSIRADSGVTEKIKSYNGKEVAIQGFIVPAGPPDLSFFLLSRVSALGNYCCEAPVGQDETVYVFTVKEVNITYDPLRIFKIVGVFEADEADVGSLAGSGLPSLRRSLFLNSHYSVPIISTAGGLTQRRAACFFSDFLP